MPREQVIIPEIEERKSIDYDISEQSSLWLGIVVLFFGSGIAIFGRRLFPYIASTAAGLLILDITVYGSVLLGFSKTNVGLILSLIIGMVLSIIGGMITRKVLSIGIFFMCILQGLMLGFLLYGVIIFFTPVWSNFYGLAAASGFMTFFGLAYTFV